MILHPESHPNDEGWSSEPELWREEAACLEYDPADWFPDKGESASTRRAKKVCFGCPVILECRDWALAYPTRLEGIWGGTTAKERLRLPRRAA